MHTTPPAGPSRHNMFQEDAPRGRATREVMPSFDPEDPDVGFPLEHLGLRRTIVAMETILQC
jgi:hypothetical protein